MNPDLTPMITFVGKSGTGKTTFLEKLIPVLKARGLRLAVLKHDAHHFEMDKPGKDTYRFTAAGADVVTISNQEKFAMIEQPPEELSLRDIVSRLPQVDIVLTEGYKKSSCPKIEIHRQALNRPILSTLEELLVIMTDEPLDNPAPQLPLEDVEGCADVIEAYLARFSAGTADA
ncbi:MAG: molybdopterin-guanine dinucleotide biosynthesis protein B [Oscillospiraceae bacterium]|nr:molybdopterin-guanine dinucleotide biosynthesis protein B [Oscillospiraceae bacterium]